MMANNLLYTDAQSFFRAMPFSDPKTFFEAQRTAWGLNDLALNYALELNKTLLNLWKEQIGHCAAWPQRVAECRTAEEVVRVHADLIGKTTQDYKQGFDRLAGAGEE